MKLKPSERIVIYDELVEVAIYENEWITKVKKLPSQQKAEELVWKCADGSRYRNVYGPLKQA